MDVWADERALYIWSGNEKADLTPVKAAKAALGITETVKPMGVTSLGQLAGRAPRVLAIGSRPPFLCDYALTSDKTSAAGWERALSWVLGLTEHDPKATTVTDILVSIMGPGVRELSPEELAAERKLISYLEGSE